MNERNDLNLSDIDAKDDLENLFIEVSNKNYSCIIGAIYRHPSQNISSFLNSLEMKLLSKKFSHNIDYVLLGDLNINVLNYQTNRDSKKFLDLLTTFNFLPLTTLPTRITDSTSTLIDHIFYRPALKHKKATCQLILLALSPRTFQIT